MMRLLLILLSVSLLFSAQVFGQYTIRNTTIFTAQVIVTGSTNTSMDVVLFNRSNNTPAPKAIWTNISLPIVGNTSWRISAQYARISFTNYNAGWGLTFASDNKNAAIQSPVYTGSDATAAGLISANGSRQLSMAWQVQDNITEPARITNPIEDPVGSGAFRFTNVGWTWKYLVDQVAPAFTNTSANGASMGGAPYNYYVCPVNDGGILWGGAASERSGGSTPVYIYMAADFATATAQTYQSTSMTVEMFQP